MSQTKKVGTHATTIYQDNGYTAVKYQYTDVVKFNEKEIILNSNGWYTNTTKTRMNQTSNQFGLGFCVYQENFSWFVGYKDRVIPFTDNMILVR